MKPPNVPDPKETPEDLVDPDAPPTEEELRLARSLREAIESADDASEHEDANLLASLAAAYAPRPIAREANAALVRGAITGRRAPGARRSATGVVIRVAFGVSAAVAVAAAVVIFVLPGSRTADVPFLARSTQSLFDEPFARGATASRIDRITSVRAAEFRENRFAGWGVR